MKKLLTVLLALLLCFSLTACKNDEKESTDTTVKETTISETVVEAPVEETTTTTEVVKEVEETTKVEEVKKENSTLSYWVNFLNKDGSVLQRTTYKYGETPTYNGSTPTYSDYAYYYSFKCWDKKTSPVYGTQTYTALYDIVGEVESKKQSSSNESTSTPNYLTFTAVTAGSSVTPNFVSGTWEYSTDGGNTWNTGKIYKESQQYPGEYQSSIDGGTNWSENTNNIANVQTTITLVNVDDSVMLRGTNCITSDGSNVKSFSMTGSITASGDVTSLTNGKGGDADLTDYCYCYMFACCNSLTTAPNLPSTTLADSCYYQMFVYCTSLTTAPNLPATTLAKDCYYSMFSGCTSLTTAPNLPATTLADSCYYMMFHGCEKLTKAPALPAKTLANCCYWSMFEDCRSLTTAPDLPAKTLAGGCYCSMFSRCNKLDKAPKIEATTLAEYYFDGDEYYGCCDSMFAGCTSLTTAPELNAIKLTNCCYYKMFYGCTSLKINNDGSNSGTAFFTCTDTSGLTDPVYNMFANCNSAGFTGTPSTNNTYYWYK